MGYDEWIARQPQWPSVRHDGESVDYTERVRFQDRWLAERGITRERMTMGDLLCEERAWKQFSGRARELSRITVSEVEARR